MKIGVYGGTFDPPHLGHMEAARQVMEHMALDRLLLIPNKLPPHKDLPPDAADEHHRLAMTAMMADGLGEMVTASPMELEREGPSYSADTMEALAKQFPHDELWLLMGTDMFTSIQSWHEPQRIFQVAGVVGFARDQSCAPRLEEQRKFLVDTYGARARTVTLSHITKISSTQLRGQLAKEWDKGGKGGVKAAQYLWPPVYGYILRNGLYGTKADLKHLSDDQLRAVSYSMIRAKRIPHVRGTEETAVALALRWGVDPQWARRAAILHDCTKYLELDEQLALCEEYQVELDELEREVVKLLHAKTGAALARHMFGEPDPVYDAIYCHTTGKANMTTFDKILYLADYMEPNRDFEGVENLRKLVWEDLDRAMVMGLEMTMAEMKEKNAPVHRNTLQAVQQLKDGIR